jgi:hypothetical protein
LSKAKVHEDTAAEFQTIDGWCGSWLQSVSN